LGLFNPNAHYLWLRMWKIANRTMFKGIFGCYRRYGLCLLFYFWFYISCYFQVSSKLCWASLSQCYDVAVAQINYPSFKHNTQDSIEQAKGRSHEEGSSQIFILDDMHFGGEFGHYLG